MVDNHCHTNTQPGLDREQMVVPLETNESKAAAVCSIQLGSNLHLLILCTHDGCYRTIISKSLPENGCLFGALERQRKWLQAFVTEENKPVKSLKATSTGKIKGLSLLSCKCAEPCTFSALFCYTSFCFPDE